jgi:hypothetical protein
VPGSRSANTLECTNTACRADLTFDFNKRVVVVDKTPEDKAEELAAAAAKKAAAAAKKVRTRAWGTARARPSWVRGDISLAGSGAVFC